MPPIPLSSTPHIINTWEQFRCYSFGMVMDGRVFVSSSGVENYKYGFNTQEKDDEVYGKGNSTTAEFWQYDARIGRRWNVDPITFPWTSSYEVFGSNPIFYSDYDGLYKRKSRAKRMRRRAERAGYEVSDELMYNEKRGYFFRIENHYNARTKKYDGSTPIGKAKRFGKAFKNKLESHIDYKPGRLLVRSNSNPDYWYFASEGKNAAFKMNQNIFDVAKMSISMASVAKYGQGYLKHNKYGWKSAKGVWNNASVLNKGANGKYVVGVAGKRLSEKTAKLASKGLKAASKKIGVLGAGVVLAEGLSDGSLSYGDMAKVGITALSTFGPVGWIYAGLDLTVSLFNDGKGITDMIGEAIDEATGDAQLGENPLDASGL